MDPMATAQMIRARSALDAALSTSGLAAIKTRAAAFVDAVMIIARDRIGTQAVNYLQHSKNAEVQRAFAHALGDDLWDGPDAQALAASYIASIAEGSLLDQIARYAVPVPLNQRRGIVASGMVGDLANEGAPRVIKNLDISELLTGEPATAMALLVLSEELLQAAGDAGRIMFESELRKAILRAMNERVLLSLTTTSAEIVSGTGDPLADLRAGLRAAPASQGYVVAASTAYTTDLATRTENRGGMGVRGGTFVPGIEIVAVDSIEGLRIIPASHLAFADGGLRVNTTGEASVNMADTPTSPSQLVSLFQTNSLGLLAAREFLVASKVDLVVVTES